MQIFPGRTVRVYLTPAQVELVEELTETARRMRNDLLQCELWRMGKNGGSSHPHFSGPRYNGKPDHDKWVQEWRRHIRESFPYRESLADPKGRRGPRTSPLGMDYEMSCSKWDDEYAWHIKRLPSVCRRAVVRDICKAVDSLMSGGRKKLRFKGRGMYDLGGAPSKGIGFERGRINLGKPLGWVKTGPLGIQAKIVKITNWRLFRRGGRWMLSMSIEADHTPDAHDRPQVGVDFGVVKLATLSNGESFDGMKASLDKDEERLVKLRKDLARKQKGSANRKKTLAKVSKLAARIANKRKHIHRGVAKQISANHGTIYVEDLKVKNMTKSAKGTTEEPGTNVKAKSGLNREVLKAAPSAFVEALESRARWDGNTVVKVDPRYTSQICSRCGNKDAASRTSQANFECTSCGAKMNADVNAARNILARGLASAKL